MFDTFLPERTLATFGSLAIHWYGLFAAAGALAAYLLGRRLAKRFLLSTEQFGDAFFLSLVSAVLGARLWHVVGDFGYYREHLGEIPAIWGGGLALHGGVVGGLLGLWWFARWKGLSLLMLTDLFAPLAALAHGLARWGNYFNQELFGRSTPLPWGIPIAPIYRPVDYTDASHFHPLFLYEFAGLLLLCGLLVFLLRRRGEAATRPWDTPGSIFGIYLVLSGALRSGLEFLRVDSVLTVAQVRVPLLVSLAMVITGLIILKTRLRFTHPSLPAHDPTHHV